MPIVTGRSFGHGHFPIDSRLDGSSSDGPNELSTTLDHTTTSDKDGPASVNNKSILHQKPAAMTELTKFGDMSELTYTNEEERLAMLDSMAHLKKFGFTKNCCDKCGKKNSELDGKLIQVS
jgi:hypothetical protein